MLTVFPTNLLERQLRQGHAIDQLHHDRPVLVGWSYGSFIICDYLRRHGQDRIAAINFVERVREAVPKRLPSAADSLRLGFGWASPKPGESADKVVRRAETRLMMELLG